MRTMSPLTENQIKLCMVEESAIRATFEPRKFPPFDDWRFAMLKKMLPLLLFPVSALADISDEANACIDELISRHGNVGGDVLGQEFSEAAIMVRLRDGNGVEYECIVWSGPEVAELRPINGEDKAANDGGGASAGASAAAQTVSGEHRVKFDSGTSAAAISGTLQAGTSVRYILGATDGQFLNVDVGSHGGALDYKVFNPDGSLLLDLISSDTPYRGQLWQSGDHVVEVINAGAQPVTFDVGMGID
ncbi:hypothetical protein Q4525_14020 [Shimia thalassica]|uniref:hypothetical protein n=1 Tax=Shimia thalassica TaxID=1715693 RepID=UPI001C09EABD|nr:hypothetical protein [Shimia thalassica]MBU2941566.1 hypothetical protein [Shimia thalassica]MDO6504053.1 hypothetical protein [Shimia thalassica]